jgi:FAD/FMN-containing dehydrogenase
MGNSPSALNKCLTTAVGSNVAFPSLVWQLTDVKPYNLDISVNPLAITYPKTNEQVAAVVTCATNANAKVQARSGGHSYGNYGIEASIT